MTKAVGQQRCSNCLRLHSLSNLFIRTTREPRSGKKISSKVLLELLAIRQRLEMRRRVVFVPVLLHKSRILTSPQDHLQLKAQYTVRDRYLPSRLINL
jgi:hypothetical protein